MRFLGLDFRDFRLYIAPILACIVYGVFALFLSDTGFFWDSTSVLSCPATVLYENNLSSFSFPEQTVTDNLPLSVLLAGWWMVFGRTCLSTHILFMLFGFGNIIQIFLLCRDTCTEKRALPYVFILALSDTVLVTQLLFPMFDSVLLFFTLLSIRSILCLFNKKESDDHECRRKKFQGTKASVVLWTICLAMLRSRGVIFCAFIGSVYCLLNIKKACSLPAPAQKIRIGHMARAVGETVLIFLPALSVALCLLYIQNIHQAEVFGLGKESPWRFAAPCIILRNMRGFIRFMLEYNKFFLWAVLLWLLLFVRRKYHIQLSRTIRMLMLVCTLFLIGCIIMTVPFINPFGPRYFLVFFVLICTLTGVLLFEVLPFKKARIYCLVLSLMLWCGHFWPYPDTIAKSWDTTLAHIPYYSLRQKVLDYLDENDIKRSEVHSFFPMVNSEYYMDLKDEKTPFSQHEPIFPDTCRYILFSNIFNIGSPDKAGIDGHHQKVRRFKKGYVYIDLYEYKPTIPHKEPSP